MDRDDFESGDRVINRKDKRRGTVVDDRWGCCTPDEVAVVYDGEQAYDGTDWRDLVKMSPVN
jgi:hypothetical protein